ncbi:hypothetical protein [Mastigocladopsis repens]|uniref:hypothetical protein n=1 Tax=Mastigocladopsis repens TaxID=221287 RepID=UPI00030186F8|nr:hypothetical protein [Mastigocladopsis repens]
MSTDTSFNSSEEPHISQHIQSLQELHREEMESVIGALAHITNLSPEQIKPHVDSMLKQLVKENVEQRPFHETATASEWVKAFREWAANHHHNAPPLSEYALSRESIYEDDLL